jgi:D-glycero-D-manno-heptose 1,7-bisphosphate phosphatase
MYGTNSNGAGRKAVFLDKDGTLVEDVPYNVDPKEIRLIPGTLEAVRQLAEAGFAIAIITNQSGVARGYFPEAALERVEEYLRLALGEVRVPLLGFYYCPHHPDGVVSEYAVHCDCRKPAPGLLERAATENGIDLSRSWFIGDILHDVEAGRSAGSHTILIDNGGETEWELTRQRLPDHVCRTLPEAVRIILALEALPALQSSEVQ